MYPVCKLCGKPIKIDSLHASNQLGQRSFSWDHIRPKIKGGGCELENMQATHKICNNKRGTEPLYTMKIKISVEMDAESTDLVVNKKSRYHPSHFGLRKQDAWCHKYKQQQR